MRCIVVGGTGYIGSQILARSRSRWNPIGTSSQTTSAMLHLDLRDPVAFDYSIIGTDDVIFLTAGISAPDRCANDYQGSYAVNVKGTSEFIARSLERGARVIFFSSDTVYGESDTDVDESGACHPGGQYGRMKHEVEQRFLSIPAFKAIRLSFVFSRRDQFTKYLLHCASTGTKAEVFHPFYRAVIHLDDVVDGVLALAQKWNEISAQTINFGGPDVVSRADFAEIIRSVAVPSLAYTVKVPPPEFLANRPGTIRMRSPRLGVLLDRAARSLAEAAKIEFGASSVS